MIQLNSTLVSYLRLAHPFFSVVLQWCHFIVHNRIVGAGWGSQASFSERMTMQVGHISLGEWGFPSGKHGKGSCFCSAENPADNCESQEYLQLRHPTVGSIPPDVVSRILAGIKAGRRKNKTANRFKDDLDLTMKNAG